MELKDIVKDKDGKFHLGRWRKKGIEGWFEAFIYDTTHVSKPEIILTKEEAKQWGLDLKKHPKGFFMRIDKQRVPINIKD